MAVSISRAWDEASLILKRDSKAISTVALALVAMPFTLSALIAPAPPAGMDNAAAAQPGLLSIVVLLVLLLGTLAITAIALRPQSTVGDAISDSARKMLPMIGAWFVVWIPLFLVLTAVAMFTIGDGADPEAIQASLAAGVVPGSLTNFLLVCVLIGLLVGVKLMLMTPVAVAETSNPLHIVSRSWKLTRGHFLKLLGFTLLFALVAIIVLAAVRFVFGGIVIGLMSAPEPMSVSALLIGLMVGLCYAAIISIYCVMIARIYAQVAAPDTGVPNIKRG